jgi:predicted  nucleic acid-binding Zn-ribbon protein
MSDTESDTESVWEEWGELEMQIQQLVQSHEKVVASLERIQEALSTEIQITQDGVSRDFEVVLDELHEATREGMFWKPLLEMLEKGELS